MKLRNKQTGETITLKNDRELALLKFVESSLPNGLRLWEEVKEPFIKDEKVRKAVRAWAEANNFLDEIEVHSLTAGTRFSIGHYDIEFLGYFIYDLESNKTYTIEELCGEEEE